MSKDLKFHVFETKTSKDINKFITLQAAVTKIKNGDNYKQFIDVIRKEGKNSPLYETILNSRECIVWNTNSNVSKPGDKKILQGLVWMQKSDMTPEAIIQATQLLKTLKFVVAT